ncbi:MAG TPA: hypothetical protein VHN18_04025 [Micromonosporaceae bacterium]|nr:hypothetical protein [Micromonosporaceae bacterium]
MSAVRTAVRGLSTDELQTIRDTLAAGRKPKVQFTESAGQVAGQSGQVVELTDPTVSDEWVVVRFGRDELPFSPTDLSIPPRGASRRAEPKSEPAPEPEFRITRNPVPAVRTEAPAQAAPAAAPALAEPKPARRAAKTARTKAPAGLTVTLAYAEGEWTVSAMQGSKALAKPYTLRPAEALKMVALVDVPGVHEAVEQIMAAERSAAEQQAKKLRTELAEIEARLAELRDVA